MYHVIIGIACYGTEHDVLGIRTRVFELVDSCVC